VISDLFMMIRDLAGRRLTGAFTPHRKLRERP
jgi:hypothetical protein